MKPKPLTVAISSRALFDLRESNGVYEEEGLEAYRRYQIDKEDQPLDPGEGFLLVKKLLNINKLSKKQRVDIILLSRNTADTGLRIFNSIRHHGLEVAKAAFCGGESPYRYVKAFGCDLFLSADGADVRRALEEGVAAANLLPSGQAAGQSQRAQTEQLRFAFDGDAVLFSDEAERVFQAEGLDAFSASEAAKADEPLPGGPFKSFLGTLQDLQQEFDKDCPIRTALVTARGAPAHERVIRTLRAWNIRLDESLFLGGMKKAEFLKAFAADVFFDDQTQHCQAASAHTSVGHVPIGVTNQQ